MEETVEITLKVDEYVSVAMKLPKVMDAETLQGVLQRVSKVTKISGLPSPTVQRKARKGSYDFLKDRNKAIEVISRWYKDKEGREALAKSYGREKNKFEPLIYYVRDKFKITDKEIK
jgi:hypothetical protein